MAEAEKIPQHHHCVACGKAFAGSGRYCSVECEMASRTEVKGKVRKLGLVWVAIVVVTVILVLMI